MYVLYAPKRRLSRGEQKFTGKFNAAGRFHGFCGQSGKRNPPSNGFESGFIALAKGVNAANRLRAGMKTRPYGMDLEGKPSP